jgi:phosphatidylglycerophosphatase A
MADLSRLIASGLGLGYTSRRAPGTAASLVAALVGARVPRGRLAVFAAAAGIGGWIAVRRVPEGLADPGWIVVDEIAGQWLALLAVPPESTLGAAAAFALFRVLDGHKLGPVGWADRRGGMVGVMLDDIVAGAIAAGLLAAARRATPGWRWWRW